LIFYSNAGNGEGERPPPTENLEVEFRLQKSDSVLIYSIDQNHYVPVFIKNLIIKKNENQYVSIGFKEHAIVKQLSADYKTLNFSNIDYLWSYLNTVDGVKISGKGDIDKSLHNDLNLK
jgi:hypothetical protein